MVQEERVCTSQCLSREQEYCQQTLSSGTTIQKNFFQPPPQCKFAGPSWSIQRHCVARKHHHYFPNIHGNINSCFSKSMTRCIHKNGRHVDPHLHYIYMYIYIRPRTTQIITLTWILLTLATHAYFPFGAGEVHNSPPPVSYQQSSPHLYISIYSINSCAFRRRNKAATYSSLS